MPFFRLVSPQLRVPSQSKMDVVFIRDKRFGNDMKTSVNFVRKFFVPPPPEKFQPVLLREGSGQSHRSEVHPDFRSFYRQTFCGGKKQ